MTTLNLVDIENGTVNVAEYSATDAALALLKEKYAVVPDANTDEGYAFVKGGIKELTTLRTSLETARKREKEPYLQAGRIIDAEAKRITTELVALEDPMKAAKKEVDDRIERERQARIARLQAKVDAIIAMPASVRGKSSIEISDMLDRVGEIDASHDFYDLTKEAIAARDNALDELARMLTERLAFEAAETARKKLEAEQAEMRRQMEAQQAEARRQREEMQRQQDEMQRQMDEQRAAMERQQAEMQRQQAEMQRQQAEMERARVAALEPVMEPEPVAVAPAEPVADPEPVAPAATPQPIQIVPQAAALEPEPVISIPVREYNELLEAKSILDALIAAGVDNWDGWDEAMEMLKAA